jgi:hypothetical protein
MVQGSYSAATWRCAAVVNTHDCSIVQWCTEAQAAVCVCILKYRSITNTLSITNSLWVHKPVVQPAFHSTKRTLQCFSGCCTLAMHTSLVNTTLSFTLLAGLLH